MGLPRWCRWPGAWTDFRRRTWSRSAGRSTWSINGAAPACHRWSIKAICDRLFAALLLVVLSPLLLLLAIVVRIFVGSPLLYVQRRGGLYGRPFSMLKFRTMRVGAEAEREALLPQNEMDGPVFKLTNDPRVTRFGRLLRRFSLDELPQLLNVLAGHMSLVGPRPLPVEETAASPEDTAGGSRCVRD